MKTANPGGANIDRGRLDSRLSELRCTPPPTARTCRFSRWRAPSLARPALWDRTPARQAFAWYAIYTKGWPEIAGSRRRSKESCRSNETKGASIVLAAATMFIRGSDRQVRIRSGRPSRRRSELQMAVLQKLPGKGLVLRPGPESGLGCAPGSLRQVGIGQTPGRK